jgi:hypothetical protein
MKRLTEEEAGKIMLKPAGRGSLIRTMLLSMKPGEILLIEPKDWKWKKKTPTTMCRRVEKKTTLHFTCLKAADGSGWVVRRVK